MGKGVGVRVRVGVGVGVGLEPWSLSCRQHLTCSARASQSGKWWYSVTSGSSASRGSIATPVSPLSHLVKGWGRVRVRVGIAAKPSGEG